MRTILSTLGVAAAMLVVSGCCEPQHATQPAYPSVALPLLTDLEPACPPPHMIDYRTAVVLKTAGSPEERVYDLGDGLLANSSAVHLAGGREKPLLRYRAGGVGCAPVKPSARPRAVATSTVIPAPEGQPMVYGFCPVPEGSEAVCVPGEFLSECFTMTDQDKAGNMLDIYVPGVGSKYDAVLDKIAPAPAVESESTASTTPAAAVLPTEPARTEAIPPAPQVDTSDSAAALRQIEKLEAEESPLTAPVPAPEVAPTTTSPLVPQPETAEPVAAMPPVPVVSDLNHMAENLSPTPSDPSNLPEVVLPPKLN